MIERMIMRKKPEILLVENHSGHHVDHRHETFDNKLHSYNKKTQIQPTTTCNQHHSRRNHRNHQQHRHRRQRQHSLGLSIHVRVVRQEQLQTG